MNDFARNLDTWNDGWEEEPVYDACDLCGNLACLIDRSFTAIRSGRKIGYWICSRCYWEECDEYIDPEPNPDDTLPF